MDPGSPDVLRLTNLADFLNLPSMKRKRMNVILRPTASAESTAAYVVELACKRNERSRSMTCRCRNSDSNSPLPPGADGCTVDPEIALEELSVQTEKLRDLLTLPTVLTTQASLLLSPGSGEGLLGSLALRPDDTDQALVHSDRAEDFVTNTTKKKENLNGYL
jgi:hypothetical protein